jgi:hypothetical protein
METYMLKNRYRVVTDKYAGYEAQVKYWWFPLMWFQCFRINTNHSIEQAKQVIERHKRKVVFVE